MANTTNTTTTTTNTTKEVVTMTEKKVTKREMYAKLLSIEAVASDTTLVEFINHEVELLDRKRSNTGKVAENKAKANAPIKAAIVEVLTAENRPMTVTEIISNSAVQTSAEGGVSSSKATAMLKSLITDGVVVRTEEKKKAYFNLA